MVEIMEFTHKGGSGKRSITGKLANQSQSGEEESNEDPNSGSHSIMSFFNNIQDLREGTYIWNGKDWELQGDKKE